MGKGAEELVSSQTEIQTHVNQALVPVFSSHGVSTYSLSLLSVTIILSNVAVRSSSDPSLLRGRECLICKFDSSIGKESACNAGDPGSIPESGRCPGEGKGYPLQYS